MPGTRCRRPKPLVLELPPIVKLLATAGRWQAMLARGVVVNRAALARLEATSSNRVAQVLRLLDLPSDFLAALREMPPGTPPRLVTERALRRATETTLTEMKERCLALRRPS